MCWEWYINCFSLVSFKGGMMKILLIALFSFLYFSSFGYAQKSFEIRIIKDFREAVFEKDQDKIHAAWMKLWANDDAMEYMKKSMPDDFLLYKSHRLVMRVDGMKGKYSGGSLRFSKSGFTPSLHTTSSKPTTGGGNSSSNRTTAKKNPNQKRISNNITTRKFPNQKRMSNQRLMRGAINNGIRVRNFSNSRRYQRRQKPNRVK